MVSYTEIIIDGIVFLYAEEVGDRLKTIPVGAENQRDAIFRNFSCVHM